MQNDGNNLHFRSNCIRKEIKIVLNIGGGTYYHSLKNLYSTCLLFENVKNKIYKIVSSLGGKLGLLHEGKNSD